MPSIPSYFSIFTFPEIDFTAAISTGRTEAEDLTVGSGFEIRTNPHASGNSYLQASGSTSQAGGVFLEPKIPYDLPGLYYVTIGYSDETDGVSRMELVVNGDVVGTFDWDSLAGTEIVTKQAMTEITFHDVALETGDVIELRGAGDGREPLRTDYLEIQSEPALYGDYFRIQAEDFEIINGFSVVRNNASSGRYMLQHTDGPDARAELTIQYTGTFDINLAYYDEIDGVSHLSFGINDDELGALLLDSQSGDAIASPQSTRVFFLKDIELEAGDVFYLSGAGDGGEPLRIDFLDFTLSDPPPPEVDYLL